MRVVHRISVATSKTRELLPVLESNGIHFEVNQFVCGFDIGECEDHEKYGRAAFYQNWFDERNLSPMK